jgi:integrase
VLWRELQVERLPSGKYRARFRDDTGRKKTLGVFLDPAQAAATLSAAVQILAGREMVHPLGISVGSYALQHLDRREVRGVRDIRNERNRFSVHIAPSRLAQLPIHAVRTRDIREWVDTTLRKNAKHSTNGDLGRRLSPATVKRGLALLSALFAAAQQDGLIDHNPTTGVKVHRAPSTEEKWTYLTVDEQAILHDKVKESCGTWSFVTCTSRAIVRL